MNSAQPSSAILRISANSTVSSESDHGQSFDQFMNVNTPLSQQKNVSTATRTAHTTRSGIIMAWLPYTLRWPYFLAIVTFTSLLEIAVVVVHSISWRNSGVVADNGSGILEIGSKFAPTLLATIYVFLSSILLDDVKRTEPFARLSSPTGAPADLSISWTADAWWEALFGSFPRRGNKTNWPMLCTTLAFMLGFLIVSPLSSSLIVSQTVVLTQKTQFLQLNISPNMPIQAKPLSETYYRSISSVLRNVTTSAWISDQYAVVPFWPASFETAPLGPILFDTDQTWTATTSVLSTELTCEPIKLKNISDIVVGGDDGYTSVYGGKNATLSSQGDCAINLQYPDMSNFDLDGGIVWAAVNNTGDWSELYISGGNASIPLSCSKDEFYITSVTKATPDGTIMVGEACKASYFLGDSVVTASLINGQSVVKIDEQQYQTNRRPISPTVADISTFQNAFLSSNWSIHLSASDITRYSGGAHPLFVGPGNLLAAIYDFSPEKMKDDAVENRKKIIQRIKRRFFGELLRDCFNENRFRDPVKTSGVISTSPRRLVVVSAVAITLEFVLLLILTLLSTVFVLTRLRRRPLGLDADPASAMSIAKILSDDNDTMESFLNIAAADKRNANVTSLKHWYGIAQGRVRLISRESLTSAANRSDTSTGAQPEKGPTDLDKTERSTVFGVWPLVVLIIILTALMVTILTLYVYSRGHKLYQKAFVYTIPISVKGVDLGDANPASIITTLIAVIVGLWWGSLDTNLRRAQPFLALAMGPVIGSKGTSISYRSSYLLWASVRAARRNHWLLFLVCTGAFLSQILTIAMSSLWYRQPGVVSVNMQIPKTLELRRVPILSKGIVSNSPRGLDRRSTALSGLFGNLKASWMYGAAVQLSLQGPEPSWSSDGWNFVPVDLAPTNPSNSNTQSTLNESNPINNLVTKATLETQAIRGRLDCSEYDFLNDTSSWMIDWILPDNAELNVNISHGYELRTNMYFGLYEPLNYRTPGSLDYLDYEDPYHPRTTLFSSDRRLQCCQNATHDRITQSSIGYWSPNLADSYYPAIANVWPANFTVKWIRGRAIQASLSYSDGADYSSEDKTRLIWTERPQMAALNCMPIIETANASVTVDATSGHVTNFKLLGQSERDEFAWTDDFLAYKQPDFWGTNIPVNMTTSHGILFILGLLGSADLENLTGATNIGNVDGSESFGISTAERLEEQTFNIREPGLNVDYMTYAMLSLVKNNHSALLEAETLKETAQKTFSAFFQHFVNNKISMTSGGYAYQSPDEKLPADIGEPYEGNFPNTTKLIGSDHSGNITDKTVHVSVSRPMEVLSMSKPAAWICMSILGYLIITCVLLAIASRRYNRLLLRQVNSISDIAFLIAGSHRLLNIARERTLESIKHDDAVKAKLDWFVTDQGGCRWGIEVVGEPDLNLPPIAPIREPNSFLSLGEGGDAEDEDSWHDAVVSEIIAVGN